MLAELMKPLEGLPPADDKSSYHSLVATVVSIDPAQTLYYCACPANNRKARPKSDHSLKCGAQSNKLAMAGKLRSLSHDASLVMCARVLARDGA